jgi:meiotically up-regulated gene 157 (Mug157) protein
VADIAGQRNLVNRMANFAAGIEEAIGTYGIVNDPVYGQVYVLKFMVLVQVKL